MKLPEAAGSPFLVAHTGDALTFATGRKVNPVDAASRNELPSRTLGSSHVWAQLRCYRSSDRSRVSNASARVVRVSGIGLAGREDGA